MIVRPELAERFYALPYGYENIYGENYSDRQYNLLYHERQSRKGFDDRRELREYTCYKLIQKLERILCSFHNLKKGLSGTDEIERTVPDR